MTVCFHMDSAAEGWLARSAGTSRRGERESGRREEINKWWVRASPPAHVRRRLWPFLPGVFRGSRSGLKDGSPLGSPCVLLCRCCSLHCTDARRRAPATAHDARPLDRSSAQQRLLPLRQQELPHAGRARQRTLVPRLHPVHHDAARVVLLHHPGRPPDDHSLCAADHRRRQGRRRRQQQQQRHPAAANRSLRKQHPRLHTLLQADHALDLRRRRLLLLPRLEEGLAQLLQPRRAGQVPARLDRHGAPLPLRLRRRRRASPPEHRLRPPGVRQLSWPFLLRLSTSRSLSPAFLSIFQFALPCSSCFFMPNFFLARRLFTAPCCSCWGWALLGLFPTQILTASTTTTTANVEIRTLLPRRNAGRRPPLQRAAVLQLLHQHPSSLVRRLRIHITGKHQGPLSCTGSL